MKPFLDSDKEPQQQFSLLTALFHVPAGYLTAIPGFLISFLLTLVLMLYAPGSGSQGSRTDQLLSSPFWLPEICAGLLLGAICYRRVPSRLAFFAWLLPGILLFWGASYWHRSMSIYDSTWDTYFGKDCGGSECLYQVLATAPFYTGLAYSIGAFAASLVARRPKKQL